MNLPNPMVLWASLVVVIALAQGCGSGARHPTLPAPEFEPPVLAPWDAGIAPPTRADAFEATSTAGAADPVEAAPVLSPGAAAPADVLAPAAPGNDAAAQGQDAGP